MIRPATVDDIQPIYAMMAAYFEEAVEKCGYKLEWNKESVVIYLGNLLFSDKAMNFVSDGHEGILLGTMGETWFGPNPIAKPEVLYVKPEWRNGIIARSLLKRFEIEALNREARYILWEFESGLSDHKMIGGLMEKLGYEFQGSIYKKVLGGGK